MSVTHSASDELDFRLIFEDSPSQPLGPADPDPDDGASFYIYNADCPLSTVNHSVTLGNQCHGLRTYDDTDKIGNLPLSPSRGQKPFECPSIQITSISPSCHLDAETAQERHNESPGNYCMERLSHDNLFLQLEPSYREPCLTPSPGSSISSRSWFSDASSCESVSHIYDDVESELNEAAARFSLGSPLTSPSCSPRDFHVEDVTWQPFGYGSSLSQSPYHSPRTSVTDENWLSPRPTSRPSSRPTSPYGKRRHSSADMCFSNCPSPQQSPTISPSNSPRGSITEDTWIVSSPQNTGANLSPSQCCQEADIPLKSRKTSEDQSATLLAKINFCDEAHGSLNSSIETTSEDSTGSPLCLKKDPSADKFLSVPSHITWTKPKSSHTPIFRTSSLPPLDWPLPCHYGQYELKIEVQPRTHHRAHYETEGSRGAVKAATGGHPVVKLLGYNEKAVNLQMFIGTADDRFLRPHAFYQVHRITGKTVATASQEIIIAGTKVLEIHLSAENNMCASIDCAGILKLRNSDIELRKGETDIGRKNTRVRLVFRVHIPQPNGKILSLQTASIPIECSQRSAQELPHVDTYSIHSCSVTGGAEMVITGSNILPESKVVFVEKGQDGRPQWEVEAKTLTVKKHMTEIAVEIPAYYNKSVMTAVQVQFYLCSGKRKRSQSQRFTYTPDLLKKECTEDLPAIGSASPTHMVSVPGQHILLSNRHYPVQISSHENLEQSLGCRSQPANSALVNPGVQDFSQGRNVNGREECLSPELPQLCHISAFAARSSYASLQSNVIYNGQSSLPIHLTTAQGYEPMCVPPEATMNQLDSIGQQSSADREYHISYENSSSSFPTFIEPLTHSVQSHLQTINYHGPSAIPSTSTSLLTGHVPPQLTSLPHHRTKVGVTSSLSADASPFTHSPLASPSSPQLKSVLYQSSTSASTTLSSSINNPMFHCGLLHSQSYRHELNCPSPDTFEDNNIQNLTSFCPKETHSVKPEPEDSDVNYHTAGLQDITLDDVNEIIGRDMTHETARTSQECQKPPDPGT